MKQLYIFLLLAFISLNFNAQNTFVPDDNFEQALINLGYDSGPLNDFVPTSNINTVSILNVDDKGISDLTGIEDFAALTELRCYTNSITNLDVSTNTQLIYLHCSANNLTSLDVSSNTQLQFLNCSINAINSLNLNQNSSLTNVDASTNQLTALSIVNGAGNIISNFNTINNPNLTCIQVDNATYSTNNWTDIDAQTSFSEDCHYGETYVPDDNFEQALIDLGYDSGPLDDYVPTANIDTLTSLYVNNENISDLTGIEDFVALTTLACTDNILSSIDVSNNTALTSLACRDNNLTSVDVSNNTVLEVLSCQNNNLTSLDVSNNTALVNLIFDNNSLSSLDVSNNPSLFHLTFSSNSLSSIDVSNNPLLGVLVCSSNSITSLNLTNNSALYFLDGSDNDLIGINIRNGNNTILTTFDATGNSNLTCIQVEDETYSTTNWTNIDVQTSFSEDCHYGETYVPDDNFEQALIDLGYDSGPLDDYVPTANINTVTDLNVDSKSISDLTGIEEFNALMELSCFNNNLSSLDITNNTALSTLNCSFNSLTSLDVSSNTVLSLLTCYSNSLSSLDVSSNSALTFLSCYSNSLNSLDVSNNPNLDTLLCTFNNLTSLDVSNNTALISLDCAYNNLTSLLVNNGNNTSITYFEASNNPNLNCIEVDDAAYSTTNWTNIDSHSGFSTNCLDVTYVPDDNFEQALIDLGHDFGPLDDYVFTANINTLTSLNIHDNGISDLTGIEDFVALTQLYCSNNNLTNLDIGSNTALSQLYCSSNNLNSLDLSNNTSLFILHCFGNNLNSLDVSNNSALSLLSCYGNNLSELDVSTNTSLTSLTCASNNLTSLNVKNGNNTNFSFYSSTNNPDLVCIEVDDAIYSTANWTSVDPASSFIEDCHYGETYVPDDNFEQALIDLGYDSGPLDDYVPTANINAITILDVDSKNISDLTGIEGFASLTDLNCYNNNLSSIDVSNNTALTMLVCSFNSLTSLDVSNNTELTFLACHVNNLTNLDVSNNTALTSLSCTSNSLSSLDVSNNTALVSLFCYENSINSLDVSANTALENLVCYDNNLSNLDLVNNTMLDNLNCSNNELTSLNIKNGNNTIIINFNATGNSNLTCIEVDDEPYSTANWTNIDPASSFSENCETLSLETNIEQAFSFYPNPVINELNISATVNGHYNVINVKGQILKQGILINGNNNIDMSQLKSGLYFLNIKNDMGSKLKKVIKK